MSYPKNRKKRTKDPDLIGVRLDKLVVTKKLGKDVRFNQLWECQCDCGETTTTTTSYVIRGLKKSCGCLNAPGNPRRCVKRAVGQGNRLPDGEAARNKLIKLYKRQAESRGLTWELTVDQAEALFKGDCHYCGREPKQVYSDKTISTDYTYNGIDRVENNQSYTLSNSVSCCGPCNLAKRARSRQEFLDWVERVYIHSIGRFTGRRRSSNVVSFPSRVA